MEQAGKQRGQAYKVIITERDGVVRYGYFQDGRPVELYCERRERESLIGNIYAARVERVAEGIGGAFLDIADGQKCYYRGGPEKKPVKLSPGHEDGLRGGDILLVQIRRDAGEMKLPMVDGNINLDGKYFVLTLGDKRFGISQKITDPEERRRLSKLRKQYDNEAFGIIVRTNAAGTADEVLQEELKTLIRRYETLMKRAAYAPGKTLLYREAPAYISLGKELPENELDAIVTDSQSIYEELLEYYGDAGGFSSPITFYEKEYALDKLYRLDHYFEEASRKLVWLKSGGSLVIEQTEAMVVIDVNSGAVTKKKGKQESVYYEMNCEAAVEIARQLRLRNLSGIIVVDFINMKKREQQKELLHVLEEACKKDRIACRVIDMTGLGLVEMTRTKVRKSLQEQMAEVMK